MSCKLLKWVIFGGFLFSTFFSIFFDGFSRIFVFVFCEQNDFGAISGLYYLVFVFLEKQIYGFFLANPKWEELGREGAVTGLMDCLKQRPSQIYSNRPNSAKQAVSRAPKKWLEKEFFSCF